MALRLDAVGLTLGRRRILDDVGVAFARGQVTVVLGPNGAGKTSLLRVAAGLAAPGDGRVMVGDAPLATMDRRVRARTIGYLPQQGNVAWNMPAREVVALGRLPHTSGTAADAAAIRAAIAATDTAAFADRPVGELSGGERARVLLARVLAGEPDWLLADEPLASLDPAHQLDLLDRLRDQAAAGRGVIVVLHDLAQAARVADDAVLMANGRIVASGPAHGVLTRDRLGDLFGVRLAMLPGDRIGIPVERR